MSNFEMKYTIRLYDPELVVEIGNARLSRARKKKQTWTNSFGALRIIST